MRFTLADEVEIDLHAVNVEILRMASPMLDNTFSYNCLESCSDAIKLPHISKDILKQILLMVTCAGAVVPESLNLIELFSAVNYLQINFLENQIAERVKDRMNEIFPESCIEILTTYDFFHDGNYICAKELSECCLVSLINCLSGIKNTSNTKTVNSIDAIKFGSIDKIAHGIAFHLSGDIFQAIDIYIDNYKRSDNLKLILLGMACVMTDQFEEASALVKESLEEKPNNFIAYLLSSYINTRQDHLTEALADLNKAVALNPNNAFALARRGEVYRAENNMPQALADLNQAIALNRNNAFAQIIRKEVCISQFCSQISLPRCFFFDNTIALDLGRENVLH